MRQRFLVYLLVLLMPVLMDAQNRWYSVSGSGSDKTPIENLSLLAEIIIEHTYLDQAYPLPHYQGTMINRHVWPNRKIKEFVPVTRDSKGEDEDIKGAYIALASKEMGNDGLGGELLPKDSNDKRTIHQREWDFIAMHVEKAYALYRTKRLMERGFFAFYVPNVLTYDTLFDWEKAQALAYYALQWKMRAPKVYESFHPVDVMFHSSYCTGAANILHALAMVAGFESRSINISHHSMVEIRIQGKWYWFDNHTHLNAYNPGLHNYAEVTENPFSIPYLTNSQKNYLSDRCARYRSPYHYSGSMYWHFCWGDGNGRGSRSDVADGYGLSVPYDPSTATALYPEMSRHAFLVPKNWPPAIVLTEKGSLIHSRVLLKKGDVFRKLFYINESKDNPVKGGKIKVWYYREASEKDIECTVDGKKLVFAGKNNRFNNPTLDFIMPEELLSSGIHELKIQGKGNDVVLFFYPDIIEPYYPPASREIVIPDESFHVDEYLSNDELNGLYDVY